MCLHNSLVSFHFTSRSTGFEGLSKGIFGLLVLNFFFNVSYACLELVFAFSSLVFAKLGLASVYNFIIKNVYFRIF